MPVTTPIPWMGLFQWIRFWLGYTIWSRQQVALIKISQNILIWHSYKKKYYFKQVQGIRSQVIKWIYSYSRLAFQEISIWARDLWNCFFRPFTPCRNLFPSFDFTTFASTSGSLLSGLCEAPRPWGVGVFIFLLARRVCLLRPTTP